MIEPTSTDKRESRHGINGAGISRAAAIPSTPAWNTWREWVTLWTYAFVAYTGLFVLTVTSNALNNRAEGLRVDWPSLFMRHALQEYTCAVFVPPLFWLVHRFPVDRQHWRRTLPILLVASLLFVVLKYVALYMPLVRIVFPSDTLTLSSALTLDTPQVLVDFLGVVGVAHALEFYRRAQERERIAAQLGARLSEAQLHALRAQLHPHFLFNTLNGVATLMHRDVQAADTMITDLAELLRATLRHTGPHEIPLREELALLERYLAIVSRRFGDRLSVHFHVAVDVGEAFVPQFLLQPLVENALEHGIARQPGKGAVTIGANHVGEQLCLTVRDDGPGLYDGASLGHGIGLANTRARLRELYGEAQELRLEPASAARGVCVTVMIPFRVIAPAVAPSVAREMV